MAWAVPSCTVLTPGVVAMVTLPSEFLVVVTTPGAVLAGAPPVVVTVTFATEVVALVSASIA